MKVYILLICLIVQLKSIGQLKIDNEIPIVDLVKKVFLGSNSRLAIDNIEYSGDPRSIALFTAHLNYNELIEKGIILSTGKVNDAIGPNKIGNASSITTGQNDFDLEALVDANSYDAAILEFDLISSTDSISFNFIFGSEEYPEYVNKNVNDVFGFYLSNFARGIRQNLAILPDKSPISIDNINNTKNPMYFLQNEKWDENNILKWKDKLQIGELAYTYQFDGLCTLMKVGAKVFPNERYHLKIAIADIGDRHYDSAVFLEAGSLKSTGKPTSESPNLENTLTKIFQSKPIISDNTISVNLNIEFNFDSDQLTGTSTFDLLNKVENLLKQYNHLQLEIRGHTDSVGSQKYNLALSKNRAKTVYNYLTNSGISSNRISHNGYGASIPLSGENQTIKAIF